MHSIERMRKMSDYAVEQFLRKGERYIYFCENYMVNRISGHGKKNGKLVVEKEVKVFRKLISSRLKL
jgi:hypothetical protein